MVAYITNHLKENRGQYRLLIIGYVVGIIIGALCAGLLGEEQMTGIFAFIKDFFIKISTMGINNFDIFRTEFLDNLRNVVILFALGLSAIGVWTITAAAGIKGFASGFTIAVLFKLYGIRSLLVILFAILPANILILPAYLYLAVECMKFHKTMRLTKNLSYKQQLTRYSFVAIIAFLVICCGIMIEAYLIPASMSQMAGLFIS